MEEVPNMEYLEEIQDKTETLKRWIDNRSMYESGSELWMFWDKKIKDLMNYITYR